MGIVQAVPGSADHVHNICMNHGEISEAARRDAQDAQVVVQRGGAALYLNAFLFVVHFSHFDQTMTTVGCVKLLFLKEKRAL